jgi:hypothetical protein
MKVTERIIAVCSCFCKRAPCKFCHLQVVLQPDFRFWKVRFAGKECAPSRLVIVSHCLTAPHSSNHKDSHMHVLCNIRVSKMQSEQHFSRESKGHFATRKRALFASSENVGGGLAPSPPRFLRPWGRGTSLDRQVWFLPEGRVKIPGKNFDQQIIYKTISYIERDAKIQRTSAENSLKTMEENIFNNKCTITYFTYRCASCKRAKLLMSFCITCLWHVNIEMIIMCVRCKLKKEWKLKV